MIFLSIISFKFMHNISFPKKIMHNHAVLFFCINLYTILITFISLFILKLYDFVFSIKLKDQIVKLTRNQLAYI